ncbi:MAG: hypothetical protein EA423_12270 [Phycisphaerales bacterium]|nr:MAG: hypothetical protein EA423_12270 [Phycisphaerales bacterium]
MTDRPIQPGKPASDGLEPREAVDLLLDRQLDADRRRSLLKDLSSNASASQELASLRATVALFDEPIDVPDMSGDILAELERRRAFRPAGRRLLVRVGRVAVAAAVVLTVGGVAFVRQNAPALDPSPPPAPITAFVESSGGELAGILGSTVEFAGRLASGIQPVIAKAAHHERTLAQETSRAADRAESETGLIARGIPLRYLMDATSMAASTSIDDDRVLRFKPAPRADRPGLLIDAEGRVFTLGDPSGMGTSRTGAPGVDINGVWNQPNSAGRPSGALPGAGSDFSDGFPFPDLEQ